MKAIPFAARAARRLQAWKLHQRGWSQRAIAHWLEVHAASVSRWFQRARQAGGAGALHRRKAPGAGRRLPHARWREFGVRYTPRHVGRLLAAMNWSVPRPLRRARQRHEAKITRWRTEAVACPSSKAKAPGQRIFFVDESEFYPLPAAVVRTDAPRGQRPVRREWLTRDHLAVIAAVSSAGQLCCQTRECAFDAVAVSGFLRHLLRMVSGKGLVIGDGAPIHRRAAASSKRSYRRKPKDGWKAKPCPGYAPDLNPLDTGVWHWLKDVAMANVCAANLSELKGATARSHRPLAP